MTNTDNWEKRYSEFMKGKTIGTLSSEDKNRLSPVFVNNDLEIPRLKNFIKEEKSRSYELGKNDAVDYIKQNEDELIEKSGEGHYSMTILNEDILKEARNPINNEK